MWRRIEEKTDFFLSLDWTSDGEELWRWIDWNIVPTPAVLTGLPMGRAGQMAAKQKEQWCHEKLGSEVAVYCCGTRNKQKFSGQGCVLIDDRGDLREAWEARGGIFVHHTSTAETIRQLREILKSSKITSQSATSTQEVPLQMTSICWAAQTPAGCFKPKCRYLHVPVSRRHRCWIQLWGFVWWHQRMFDDLPSFVDCIRSVYSPKHQAAFQADKDMDEQSHGAFRLMLETLRESCELGLPLDFLRAMDHPSPPSPLPPLPRQVREVLVQVTALVQTLDVLSPDPKVVVAGSMGLGADVGGSDLDLVLCCDIEVNPKTALAAVTEALLKAGEAVDVILLEQVAVPLLSFRLAGLSVDVTLNQMSSIRDILLFRYALRTAGPELSSMLRLVKMWLKARRIPGTKQGGFPTVVWLRLAIRFYQECKGSSKARRVARDWLRRFMVWAWQGLPTGGSPLALAGEQEYYSGRLAAGVPAGTLLLFVCEMVAFLEKSSAPSAVGEDFDQAMEHAHLCEAGTWSRGWALFFVKRATEGAAPVRQVLLCRVHGVFGGRQADLRCCDCAACAGGTAVRYISRRSHDWLILALPEDPRKLRVKVALRNSGILKKKAPEGSCSDEPSSWGSETLLLRPGHLIRRLQPSEDPLRAFEHAQRAADGAAWLPDPEEMAPHIPRGLLLLARPQRLEDSAVPVPTLLAVEEVCRRCPWMLKGEDHGKDGDSDEEKVVLDDRLLPAREPRRIEVCLRKVDPEDLLGFSVEADAIRPGCLQIVSISEKGLLGRRNAAVDAAERAVEGPTGSWVVEVNGVVDNLEAMRCELEAATISLVVLVPQLEESDDFGRKRPSRPAVIPHAKVQGEVPLCRCNGYCKCGLADALGRAREDYGKWNVAQPALRISNLHPAVTEEMLYSLFTELAPVATLRVVRDTKTLESELHGFVNFHTFNDAQKVLEALDGRPLHGRRCFLSWSSRARREEAEAWAPPPLSTTEGSRQIRSYQLPVAPGKVEREGPDELAGRGRPKAI